jgi:hypothetical protein
VRCSRFEREQPDQPRQHQRARPGGVGRLLRRPARRLQLYVRDLAGNLVEIDQAGVDRLPDDLRSQVKGLWDFNPQSDEHMSARLFVPQ